MGSRLGKVVGSHYSERGSPGPFGAHRKAADIDRKQTQCFSTLSMEVFGCTHATSDLLF